MKIRLMGSPERVEQFAVAMRAAFHVREESRDYRDAPPSPNVRRYLDIELRPTAATPTPAPAAPFRVPGAGPAPTPLTVAAGTKRRRARIVGDQSKGGA